MAKKSEIIQMYIYPLEKLEQKRKVSQWQAIKGNVDRIVLFSNSRIPEIKHYTVSVYLKQGGQNNYFIWEMHVYKVLTLGKE